MVDVNRYSSVDSSATGCSPARSHRFNNAYIVDDDNMVRSSLSFLLETNGFQTQSFASGRDFLNKVDMLVPGFVLLDIRMPQMDGFAVLKALGTKVHRFAIIAMSGHGDEGVGARVLKRGAKDFLEKPFTGEALTDVLTALA